MIHYKNDFEAGKMRDSGCVAARILDSVSKYVVPGVTTLEIDKFAGECMRSEGVISAFLGYRNFPRNICVSVNDEVVHGIGGSRRVRMGDIVKLDVGIVKDGWVGDTAKTVAVGVIDPGWMRLLAVTEDVLYRAIELARPGRRLGDLCAAIEDEVVANGYSVVREFVGHGVGKSLHEEPQVPNFGRPGTGPRLKVGMTLAIEPMVNMGSSSVRTLDDNWTVVTSDGSPSAHFEHTVLITNDKPEILTWRERQQ
jgi:methionyl aminopeptidase